MIPAEDDAGGLVFEDDVGNVQLISGDALAGLFELCSDFVKCVVLNACYSEAQANAITRHIDFVIGMKKAIGDQAAIKFAVGFYDALGAGRDFEGRSASDAAHQPERHSGASDPGLEEECQSGECQEIRPKAWRCGWRDYRQPHRQNGHAQRPQVNCRRTRRRRKRGQSRSSTRTRKRTATCVDELDEALAYLKRQGHIAAWHDRMIGAATNRKGEIDKNLEAAKLILLLSVFPHELGLLLQHRDDAGVSTTQTERSTGDSSYTSSVRLARRALRDITITPEEWDGDCVVAQPG